MYFVTKWVDMTEKKTKLDMVIKGDTMTSGILFGEGKATDRIKTDPSKTLAEIDIMSGEQSKVDMKAYGIYKIEGDELTMALAIGSDKGPDQRPKDFTPNERVLIFVLKRQ